MCVTRSRSKQVVLAHNTVADYFKIFNSDICPEGIKVTPFIHSRKAQIYLWFTPYRQRNLLPYNSAMLRSEIFGYFGYSWATLQWISRTSPQRAFSLWCSALSCGLQVNYVALRWTRGFSLKGETPRKRRLWSRACSTATWFIFNRAPLISDCPPRGKDGTSRTESRDRPRLTLSVFLRSDESLGRLQTTHERGSRGIP